MEANIQVIGNTDDVIYYNLNKQFCNINKAILTSKTIIDSFEDENLQELINNIKSSEYNNYTNIVKKFSEVFESEFNKQLYLDIQEALKNISNNYMDVELKNYNFMNSISNTKYNVTLRCEHFSITSYYSEKGMILSNIKNLLRDYFNFTGNAYRISRILNFQIEIYEAEEIHKTIYLKKENNSIILTSVFGFEKNYPIDYSIGCEFYVSKDEDFNFFKNKQKNAIIREHNKLVEREINIQEKVLDNSQLILINNKTSDIDDAIIECYINPKGQLKIVHLSIIENHINRYSKNGIILNKSTNNYNKISILTLRDDLNEETVNPKYILLKNDADIKEFMTNLDVLSKIDGIIFTANFYNKFLDRIGKECNIDILFIDKDITRSIDETLNIDSIDIESSKDNKGENPFNQIINNTQENKEEDPFLEEFKNIDLSSFKNKTALNNEDHNNSNLNNTSNSEKINFNNSNFNNGNKMENNNEKKNAFDFLKDNAMQQEEINKQIREGETEPENNNNSHNNQTTTTQKTQYQSNQQQYNTQANMQNQNVNNTVQSQESQSDYIDMSQINQQQEEQKDLNIYTKNESVKEEIDYSKYENVIATEIIVKPEFKGDAYLVDINNVSQVENGKIYFLAFNTTDMQNPNLNYILPIELNNSQVKNCSLLIKNVQEYFLIDESQDVDYFVDISNIEIKIKKEFVKSIIDKVGIISIICNKSDLDLISKFIDKIYSIKVKDIQNDYDVSEVKQKVLSYEKAKLLKN